MKTCPSLPPQDRDTSQLTRSLVVSAILFTLLAIAIQALKP
jgi:hypothetical protein